MLERIEDPIPALLIYTHRMGTYSAYGVERRDSLKILPDPLLRYTPLVRDRYHYHHHQIMLLERNFGVHNKSFLSFKLTKVILNIDFWNELLSRIY